MSADGTSARDQEVDLTTPDLDGARTLLEDPTGAPFGFWQVGEHFGSEVNDEPGAVPAVAANGGKALSPIGPTPFGRMAALADPAGAQFKIVEVPAT